MLLLLHGALWSPPGGPMSRALMLAHLGLFLIWQPIWNRRERLARSQLLGFLTLTAVAILWLSWWLAFGWLILLIAIVAGSDLRVRATRYAYLLALVFLVSQLLLRVVPALFELRPLPPTLQAAFQIGLFAVPAVLALLRYPAAPGNVDFFRGVSVAALVAVLAIGALVNMYHLGLEYPLALAQSLLALAAFLALISWLMSPHLGLAGLRQLWDRSVLNIGTPFETWLAELAALADREDTPERFLRSAMAAMESLPWIEAVAWETSAGPGRIGTPTAHRIGADLPDGRTELFTRRAAGPTLALHGQLLLQLLGQFYVSKLRERELAQRAQIQAVYETGARVTHDIKNLLQSLQMLTATLERERAGTAWPGERRAPSRAQRLLERQLPHIVQRLQLALDKLQAPRESPPASAPAAQWWRAMRERLESAGVQASEDIQAEGEIPVDLFDSVVENLLENARAKQALDPRVSLKVRFAATAGEIRVEVTDTGEPVPAQRAAQLGRAPVESDNGLGIGLYQAARQAAIAGYTLDLITNLPGEVTFALHRAGNGDARQYGLFEGDRA